VGGSTGGGLKLRRLFWVHLGWVVCCAPNGVHILEQQERER
jgi:hypothetical protein